MMMMITVVVAAAAVSGSSNSSSRIRIRIRIANWGMKHFGPADRTAVFCRSIVWEPLVYSNMMWFSQ